jgi:hypothetical protein
VPEGGELGEVTLKKRTVTVVMVIGPVFCRMKLAHDLFDLGKKEYCNLKSQYFGQNKRNADKVFALYSLLPYSEKLEATTSGTVALK